MPVEGVRFRVSAPRGGDAHRWNRAAKALFGLDPGRGARFLKELPRVVALIGPKAQSEARFSREGIPVEALPEAARGEPCAVHRRLIATEECPGCHERRACALCLFAEPVAHCPGCVGRATLWTRFKWLRVSVLLALLAAAAWSAYGAEWRLQTWEHPIVVAVYPVASDPGELVRSWADQLKPEDLAPAAAFLNREGGRWGVDLPELVQIKLGQSFSDEPPPAPPAIEEGRLPVALWSLKLRLWCLQMKRRHHLPSGDVEIFLLYHSPEAGFGLDRSLAVEKLRVGVVHTVAGRDAAAWTALALTHEFLHTVGATDKYLANGMPRMPDGLAQPERVPLVPQAFCEVMAGVIPLSSTTFQPAQSLQQCLVGEKTAREIGWLRKEKAPL